MKLWKLTAGMTGYDTYDAVIVAAKNIDAARSTHPDEAWPKDSGYYSGSWAYHPDEVSAVLIGTATKGTPAGVILASFNAG